MKCTTAFSRAVPVLGLLLVIFACDVAPENRRQGRLVSVFSPEMRKSVPVTVVVPEQYDAATRSLTRYPVIYLLHGYSGDHQQWSQIVRLSQLASRYQVIFVCPDGGYDSWYLDSPIADSVRYQSFIMQTLIPRIDSAYRTLGAEGRAITGLSMGGHGALRLISLFPDSFAAAGSMSGILDLRPFAGRWNLAGRLGSHERQRDAWDRASAIQLIPLLAGKNKGILVDCGSDDFAIAVNRAYRDSARVHGVTLVYEEGPGGHSREYWARRIEPQIRFLLAQIQRTRQVPAGPVPQKQAFVTKPLPARLHFLIMNRIS